MIETYEPLLHKMAAAYWGPFWKTLRDDEEQLQIDKMRAVLGTILLEFKLVKDPI